MSKDPRSALTRLAGSGGLKPGLPRAISASQKGIVEPENWGPPFGTAVNLKLPDKTLREACLPARLSGKPQAFGAPGSHRRRKQPEVGIPIAFGWVPPAVKPLEPVFDVADLLSVNPVEDRRGLGISRFFNRHFIKKRKVQIGLLKGQAHLVDNQRRAGVFDCIPEIIAQRQVAEVDAELPHAPEVELEMLLFLRNGACEACAKRVRCLGEPQEHERHELHGQQLVVGKKVQHLTAGLRLIKTIQFWKLGFADPGELGRPAGEGRGLKAGVALLLWRSDGLVV